MTDLLDGLAPEGRADLPVVALNDLSVVHTPATSDTPPRIDVAHRDRLGDPLISLDPADAATLASRLTAALAMACVDAEEARQLLAGSRGAAAQTGGTP